MCLSGTGKRVPLITRFQNLIVRRIFASDLRCPGASFGSRGRTHPGWIGRSRGRNLPARFWCHHRHRVRKQQSCGADHGNGIVQNTDSLRNLFKVLDHCAADKLYVKRPMKNMPANPICQTMIEKQWYIIRYCSLQIRYRAWLIRMH